MNTWAIVELMGHGATAGMLSNEEFEETGLLRLEVPETPGGPYSVHYYSPAAIYGVTIASESVVERFLEVGGTDPRGALGRVYDPDCLNGVKDPRQVIDLEAARKATAEREAQAQRKAEEDDYSF